jgi:hypothetical protein
MSEKCDYSPARDDKVFREQRRELKKCFMCKKNIYVSNELVEWLFLPHAAIGLRTGIVLVDRLDWLARS